MSSETPVTSHIRQTRLDNGLRVVSEARQSLQTVSVGAFVDVGSRHEKPGQHGITHCLEHMLFKGTERRSARDIAFEIEAVGGHINAYTARDHTSYYARTLKEDLPLAVDILGDLLTHSQFEAAELAREKDVIIQEIGQAEDTPDDIIFDELQAVVYPNQALGRSILGTAQSVNSFKPADLFAFTDAHYHTANTVIAAVGALDHDALVDLVQQHFSALPSGQPRGADQAQFQPGVFTQARKLEQVHLALAWPGVPFDAADYYPAQVYSTILGGGMSSRLFQEIREERGLAYSIYSFSSHHKDTGYLGVYTGTGEREACSVLSLIEAEIERLGDGPTKAELQSARAQLKAGLMMALEGTTPRMEQLGRQLLFFGRLISSEEILAKLDAVDFDAVQAYGAALAADLDKRALAAIGAGPLDRLAAA